MQAGDQAGDNHATAFAKAMAKNLPKMLAQTTLSHCEECEQLKTAFFSLNSNLRALVYQQLRDWRDAIKTPAEQWPTDVQHV